MAERWLRKTSGILSASPGAISNPACWFHIEYIFLLITLITMRCAFWFVVAISIGISIRISISISTSFSFSFNFSISISLSISLSLSLSISISISFCIGI